MPTLRGIEIRGEAELKLLGTELSDRERVQALAAGQVAHYRDATGRSRCHRGRGGSAIPSGPAATSACRSAGASCRAALEFWEYVAADPPGPAPS